MIKNISTLKVEIYMVPEELKKAAEQDNITVSRKRIGRLMKESDARPREFVSQIMKVHRIVETTIGQLVDRFKI